ncbi:hypothetical protein CERSUDRAFT_91979 [Gelatoporia subvermispora B]|uniref:Uncharacterized protein n=1 Tax=Ceriporiopsis subvermispora (strain B) TaxID=914234 RepID=M2RL00_CERS8|nr:hypothetical protein CERSUDRAFT_91979 [Gelatoporia subvermispora B]
MSSQNFVGNTPVDKFPSQATQQISDEELTKAEAHRDPNQQPGANKRAGVATRDPKQFDTTADGGRGGWGDAKPVKDPVM